MSTTSTSLPDSWMRFRDDYGRSCHALYRWDRTPHAVGVVVRMPKVYIEKYPERTYLVNAWGQGNPIPGNRHGGRFGLVTYAGSLPEAKARLIEQTK